MPKVIDHTGKRFGKLLVVKQDGKIGDDKAVLIRCDCGTERRMAQTKLTQKTKPNRSCGCASQDNHQSSHNLTKHPFYPVWKVMISRCYKESHISYSNYGGRGISVCDEWRTDPTDFIKWLESRDYGKGFQIDRIDSDGDYSHDNCRVVTPKENSNNRRNNVKVAHNGKEYGITELVEISGLKYATIYKRISSGLDYNGVIKQQLRGAS